MFCYQCQETAKNTGCTVKGVCGKNEEVAKLQDLLIYVCKGIAEIAVKGKEEVATTSDVNHEVIKSLFITITNANFDEVAIEPA
jgi:hydroxylamine reductase